MLEQLYNDLLVVFEKYPNATRKQFIDNVVALGHATAGEAGAFVDAFVNAAIEMMLLPVGSDWGILMEKIRSATSVEQVIRVSKNIVERIRERPEFRLASLQQQLLGTDEQIAEIDALRVGGLKGKNYILINFPESELRNQTIEVLEMGIQQLVGSLACWNQQRQTILDGIDQLKD